METVAVGRPDHRDSRCCLDMLSKPHRSDLAPSPAKATRSGIAEGSLVEAPSVADGHCHAACPVTG